MNRVWRCRPAAVSPWQKALGWVLAVVTFGEAAVAAKVLDIGQPILVGLLVASSVPAIFPLRALMRAPRVRLDDDTLHFQAHWVAKAESELPTTVRRDQIDLEGAAVVDLEQRTDLRVVDRAGLAMAGEQPSGWRKLATGEQAHVWLVAGQPALYLPTKDGFAFLLAVEKGVELLGELRR